MKLLITKNKYGISARISDTDQKGTKVTYFLQISMSLENEKKIEEGKAYLIDVKDCFPKAFAKKDGRSRVNVPRCQAYAPSAGCLAERAMTECHGHRHYKKIKRAICIYLKILHITLYNY